MIYINFTSSVFISHLKFLSCGYSFKYPLLKPKLMILLTQKKTFMKRMKVLILLLAVLAFQPAQAQFLKKLKDKAKEAVSKTITPGSSEKPTDNSSTEQNQGNSGSNNSGGRPTNRGGGGLKNTTPPDVNQQITDASTSYSTAKYSDARYSIQQALVGVEIQLGREILKSLPSPVVGLQKDTTQDKVTSTQWGWNNLTIQRIYSDQRDKQLTVTIGNNQLYSGMVNMYFNNAYGIQADANNQNVKQVKVKGNKAIIEYSDSKGYTLIVSLGQSAMIVWECINFADENEVMNAANSFDVEGIKKSLGEQ
jgi:hypothetical protein